MTEDEQKQFVRDLITSFPSFEDAARNSPNLGGTHRAWMRAWSDLELSDCQAVLADLEKSSEITYDEYKAPGPFIRRLVLQRRNKGKTSESERCQTALNRSQRKYVGYPMAEALSAALKAKAEGKSESECLAMIDAAIPKGSELDEPRYNCPHCLDRGLVLVWRRDFADKVIERRMSAEQLGPKHTYLVACYCYRGNDMNKSANSRYKLPVYSTDGFCRYRGIDLDDDRKRLANWIADRSKPVAWVG